jgi:hypothetical protein
MYTQTSHGSTRYQKARYAPPKRYINVIEIDKTFQGFQNLTVHLAFNPAISSLLQ